MNVDICRSGLKVKTTSHLKRDSDTEQHGELQISSVNLNDTFKTGE